MHRGEACSSRGRARCIVVTGIELGDTFEPCVALTQ
jgi:hypothetical protein